MFPRLPVTDQAAETPAISVVPFHPLTANAWVPPIWIAATSGRTVHRSKASAAGAFWIVIESCADSTVPLTARASKTMGPFGNGERSKVTVHDATPVASVQTALPTRTWTSVARNEVPVTVAEVFATAPDEGDVIFTAGASTTVSFATKDSAKPEYAVRNAPGVVGELDERV